MPNSVISTSTQVQRQHDIPRLGSEPGAAPLFHESALLTAREGAAAVRLSLAAFWRAVATGRLPCPLYPLPRAPRWRRAELQAALEATRATPTEAKAARRAARLSQPRAV
jgi:predicted DNA-binding transcriptional regulator AlpA